MRLRNWTKKKPNLTPCKKKQNIRKTTKMKAQHAASHSEEDRRSVRSRLSKASTKSGQSRASRSSNVSSLVELRKAHASSELAAKEAEFNALQEAKHKTSLK